jgi:exodeoxyribonuclease-5
MERKELYQLLENAFGHIPTAGQQTVMTHLAAFLLSDKPNPFYLLKGYAGTGKTSLVSALVKVLPLLRMRFILLAPTGRAAKVLTSYSGFIAHTIHRKIYMQTQPADGSHRIVLSQNKSKRTLFVVDEASMIADTTSDGGLFGGRNLLDDLIQYVSEGEDCRILMIGDHAQLPPVGLDISPALNLQMLKTSYPITAATFELTEVMRQALDSGILFNATRLREKLAASESNMPLLNLGNFSDITKVDGYELEELMQDAFGSRDFTKAVIVCRSNKKANMFNQAIRQRILGMEGEISSGDLLMAVKNNYYWLENNEGGGFIANGDIMEITRIKRFEEMYGFNFADADVKLVDYPEHPAFEVKLILETIMTDGPALPEPIFRQLTSTIEEDYLEEPSRRKRYAMMKKNPYFNALQVKFAYALTCHKTQGGQWPVVFLEAGINKEEQLDKAYLRWLYTAVTRATEKLYLMNFIDAFFEPELPETTKEP